MNDHLIKEKQVKTMLSDLVVQTKYASNIENENRRQTWSEAVDSVKVMHIQKFPKLKDEIEKAFNYVYDRKCFPSMRSIQFGGLPIELSPNRIFNCSYAPIDHPFVFSEAMFLLLGGTGLGYSIKQRFVNKLPMIVKPDGARRFMVGDSIEGWADSIRQLIYAYMKGKALPLFDYRDIRPMGAPIKKTGGIAPGSEKLQECHINVKAVLSQAIGRRLKPIEVHDILCFIADCILAGGVRDAAMISLFDADDQDMLTAKSDFYCIVKHIQETENAFVVRLSIDAKKNIENGICPTTYHITDENGFFSLRILKKNGGDYDVERLKETGKLAWYYLHPQRGRANNSVTLRRGDITKQEFRDIWQRIENNKTGEPGIYWTSDDDMGTNPCVETALLPYQFCNLTTVNVSDVKTQEELDNRVRAAALLGTLQASYTNFHYLRPIWKENTEKEALLGVSMTGMASSFIDSLDLTAAAKVARETNKQIAKMIGIKPAARVTCIKPEGTSTLVAGALGSGIHAVYGKYLIRSNRIKKTDPIYQYLKDNEYSFMEDEFGRPDRAVISFPLKAGEHAITRNESSIDFLNRIKNVSEKWIGSGHRKGVNHHNVSATVYIRDNEWSEVFEWLWDNKNSYNGVSVLPYMGGNYKQAPFQEITEQEYFEMLDKFKYIDLNNIKGIFDINLASEATACGSGGCEI